MNKVYSVIIPFKEKISLLKRLVESVPEREDIEIVIVNNGEEELLESFLSDRTNVTILCSNTVKGAGHARNAGLQIASGKWLLFADADDFFLPVAFEVFDAYKNSSADIIYFDVSSCYSDSLLPAKRGRHVNQLIRQYVDTNGKNAEDLRYKYLVPWGKMIRLEMVRAFRIGFEEVPVYNDVLFSLQTGHYAHTVQGAGMCVYCVTETSDSLDHRKSKEYLLTRYEVQLRRSIFLSAVGKNCYQTPFMLYYWMSALQYGPGYLLFFIRLALRNRVSLFVGWQNISSVLLSFRHKNKRVKKR